MEQVKTELSILIPTYNTICVDLVRTLYEQAVKLSLTYEIIVADDGSPNTQAIAANQPIGDLPNCQYIVRQENVGRAAIRNILAKTARYDYLLFIDSDMRIGDPLFLSNYLQSPCDTVIDGGVAICGDDKLLKGTLRYLYEKSEEARHTAEQRCQTPYQHLHTANLLIRRDIMLQYPFDERFRHYGYEDVLLGKTLRQHRIAISHIDNPVLFCDFESNPEFVAKTEEGLRTLHQFREDLRGYSRLLTFVGNIHIPVILSTIRLWHHLLGHLERKNLCGTRPCLLVFKLYRLGYFLSL